MFYDTFDNKLDSYDDATYTSQERPYAFTSIYDDYTLGATLEYGIQHIKDHFLKAAAHYKKDMHREYGPEDPRLTTSDYTVSFGVEDAYRVTERLHLNAGLSYHARGSIRADNYDPESGNITPFPGKVSHAVNGQLSASYNSGASTLLFLSVARKTRFTTIKDRYSYRMGAALPNSGLRPENAWNFEAGLHTALAPNITLRPVLFYSSINDIIQMVDNTAYDEESEQWLGQQQNTGRAEFYGAEMQARADFRDKWHTGLNYTFIKRKNLTHPDILFTDVPEHKIFAYAEYRFTDTFFLLGSLEYNTVRFSTSYGTPAGDYTLVNLKAGYRVWRYVSLEAGVNNVLDRNYAYAEGYPEPGRNAFVSLVLNY